MERRGDKQIEDETYSHHLIVLAPRRLVAEHVMSLLERRKNRGRLRFLFLALVRHLVRMIPQRKPPEGAAHLGG